MVGGSRGSVRFYRISEEDEDEYFLQAIRELAVEGDGGIFKADPDLRHCSRNQQPPPLPQIYDINQLESKKMVDGGLADTTSESTLFIHCHTSVRG